MAEIPFVAPLDDPAYGTLVRLSPLVRRIVANNPSKYSYRGTGTYIVGHDDVVVVDPGPELESHRDALATALIGLRVRAILVTHCHSDHSPLAAWLRSHTGAPTIAFGPHGPVDGFDDDDDEPEEAEESAADEAGEVTSHEAVDTGFIPDLRAVDGSVVARGPGWTMRGVFTPGHTSNHMCFALDEERALFSGDHVMGWSTTVVSPPDGDMRSYLDSLQRVIDRDDAVLYPTHGNPISDPQPFLQAYLTHRVEREQQVFEMVAAGVTTIKDIVAILYSAVDPKLHRAAGRSVLSHLIKLAADGRVRVDGTSGGAAGGACAPRTKSVYLPV